YRWWTRAAMEPETTNQNGGQTADAPATPPVDESGQWHNMWHFEAEHQDVELSKLNLQPIEQSIGIDTKTWTRPMTAPGTPRKSCEDPRLPPLPELTPLPFLRWWFQVTVIMR